MCVWLNPRQDREPSPGICFPPAEQVWFNQAGEHFLSPSKFSPVWLDHDPLCFFHSASDVGHHPAQLFLPALSSFLSGLSQACKTARTAYAPVLTVSFSCWCYCLIRTSCYSPSNSMFFCRQTAMSTHKSFFHNLFWCTRFSADCEYFFPLTHSLFFMTFYILPYNAIMFVSKFQLTQCKLPWLTMILFCIYFSLLLTQLFLYNDHGCW